MRALDAQRQPEACPPRTEACCVTVRSCPTQTTNPDRSGPSLTQSTNSAAVLAREGCEAPRVQAIAWPYPRGSRTSSTSIPKPESYQRLERPLITRSRTTTSFCHHVSQLTEARSARHRTHRAHTTTHAAAICDRKCRRGPAHEVAVRRCQRLRRPIWPSRQSVWIHACAITARPRHSVSIELYCSSREQPRSCADQFDAEL